MGTCRSGQFGIQRAVIGGADHQQSTACIVLHDGSQLTLEERVFSNVGDRHGVTSTLSSEERADLITYLKSL